MPRPNDYNAPCCPICCATMRKNGTEKTQLKLTNHKTTFIPKQRWRCSKCGYNETENSTAHNSNHRTGYGNQKLSQLSNLAVLYKPHIVSNTLDRSSSPNTCTLKERSGQTTGLESASPKHQEASKDNLS